MQGDLADPAMYANLRQRLTDDPGFPSNVAYYMAISPSRFNAVVECLGNEQLFEEGTGWSRTPGINGPGLCYS